jgi:hypothetical protein
MRRACGVTLAIAILLSFAPYAQSQASFAEEGPATLDLREAIFRYMFEHHDYGNQTKVFCIDAERPLPDNFILRFPQVKAHVVWASECDDSGPMMSIRNKKTGEPGMRMTIQSIRWINVREAEAYVEALSDGVAANSNILRILLHQGRWKVIKDKLIGVS